MSPAGVTELAERVDLPKSTVARLLATLVEQGAVDQPVAGGKYRVGGGITELAGGPTETGNLVALSRPHLIELMLATGEATGLSVPEGHHVHYLDQIESPNPVQVRDWTGERISMHAVSSGLVFLAYWPAAALEAFLSGPLERFTAGTVTEPARLRRRLAEVRRQGFAWVHEEFAEGINSVAAPIRDASGAIVAAIHTHGPAYRFPTGHSEASVGEVVRLTAEAVSHHLR